MRLLNIINQKILFAGLLLLCFVVALPVNGQQPQKEKKVKQMIDITMNVVDVNGTPIPNANVVVGEGITHTSTDANGSVSFKAYPTDYITITAPPFEKIVVVAVDITQNNTVKLLQSKLYMTSDDAVMLPFTSIKKRNLTGSEVSVAGSRFEKYPTIDLRATLTGMTSGFDIREMDGSTGMSSLEGLQSIYTTGNLSNSYGATDKFSNMPLIIVDGIPTDIQEAPVDASEIESATWMKGILSTAMFGPQANGGALLITTKRGSKNERMLNVNIENGIEVIDRMPGFVGGADYARLNNQAKTNSGITTGLYPQASIDKYAENNPYSLRYPSVNYRDMMLKNTKPVTRVNLSSSGGNDVVQYYSSVGFAQEGDIYKLGKTADYNSVTARQNVDVKINDQFDVKFGFYGNLAFRRSPNYGYDPDYGSEGTDNATLGLTEFGSVLADINSIPAIATPIYAYYDTAANVPWYGVNNNFLTYGSGNPYGISSGYPLGNPIGGLVSQGFYTDNNRTGLINVALNYDFGNLIKGLKSTTYLGYNIHNMVRKGKTNDYIAYNTLVSPKTGNDSIIRSSSHTLAQMTSLTKLMDYYFQRYSVYEVLSYDRTFGEHSIQSTLTGYIAKTYINGVEEPQRQETAVWSALYSLKDKYSIHGVLNYSGTTSFDVGKRFALFPSIGASWVISDESFMQNLKVINYMKIRAQYGVIGNETFFPVLFYVDRWNQNSSGSAFGPYSSNQWFGSTQESSVRRDNIQRIGNELLTWEKRREFNAGVDALLLNQKLSVEVTYYNWVNDGALVQLNNIIPYVAGLQGARPYSNFTKTQYNSGTLDLQYSDKVGDLRFTVGASATTTVGKRVKYDEPQYRNEYQVRTGKVSDAIFGLTYLGKFATDAEALVTPQRYDDVLLAGDLKYADLNKDGIVDDNDQSMIGHSSPRLYYSLNATLKYKNFELFILGAGRAFFDVALTNPYFWNGWGDYNYSNFVLNNVGGAYPRLTYYKVNNNFVTSDFWLTKGGYFKIQNVELSYTIPGKMLQFMGSRGIKVYVRGANLLTFSKIKDVDPESINSGVTTYPLFKTFTGGVKINF
jgi:TonB-linked SusC/RagA family outer membrane protein